MVTSFVRDMSTDPKAELYSRIGVIAASDYAQV